MKMNVSATAIVLGLGLILVNLTVCYGYLQPGFYKGKCGTHDVEAIIKDEVAKRFFADRSIVAALLRLQFHDCFVTGCDASLLLDGDKTEKTAVPNLSVRGYDIIDQAKSAVEKACPGIVSCADIIAIATRDAVVLSGGSGAKYEVQTGRRDGLVSLASSVDLPSSSISVKKSIEHFRRKGISSDDMVLLLGAHTVGITHCSFVRDRLYNFNNTAGRSDPGMHGQLVAALKSKCPQKSNIDASIDLDQNPRSTLTVDNSYYKQIRSSRGVLSVDQAIAWDSATKAKVASLADGFSFNAEFGAAMVKMGAVEVLTGTQGEIRQNCRAVNPKAKTFLLF